MVVRKIFYTGLFFLLFCLDGFSQEVNLIKNPGFEEGTGSLPDYWSVNLWDKKPETTRILWEEGGAHGGEKYMVIDSRSENDARLIQSVQVEPNKIYKLSCWVKTKNVGLKNLGASFSVIDYMGTVGDLRGTNDKWQEMTVYLKTESNITFLQIGLGLGGYANLNTGTVMFDDIALYETESLPQGERQVLTIKREEPKESELDNYKINYSIKTGIEVQLMIIFFIVISVLVILFIFIRTNPRTAQRIFESFRKKPVSRVPDVGEISEESETPDEDKDGLPLTEVPGDQDENNPPEEPGSDNNEEPQ